VLAVGDHRLERWFWRPEDGFVQAGTVATSVVATSALVEDEAGSLHLLAAHGDGSLTHRRAVQQGYPDVSWRTQVVAEVRGAVHVELAEAGDGMLLALVLDRFGRAHGWRHSGDWRPEAGPAGLWGDLVLVGGATPLALGLDRGGALQVSQHRHGAWVTVPTGSTHHFERIGAAATTIDGGRIDLVGRCGAALWHLNAPDAGSTWSSKRILSQVWCPHRPATLHRRLR
jgi:hypothetical protein